MSFSEPYHFSSEFSTSAAIIATEQTKKGTSVHHVQSKTKPCHSYTILAAGKILGQDKLSTCTLAILFWQKKNLFDFQLHILLNTNIIAKGFVS
jgi:hypothetical protein